MDDSPSDKDPSIWKSSDGRVAIKLDMLPGDQAILAMSSPPNTRGVSIFWYPDASVTIVACQDRDITLQILQQSIDTLKAVP
jgi:hypothetical protein